MTTSNAFAFVVTGLVMYLAPGVWPDFFQPHGLDGANTSALWLAVMSPVHAGIGLWQVFCNEVRPLWQLVIEWEPASVVPNLQPMLSEY